MKPEDRYAWIEQYLRENAHGPTSPCHVDILNRHFVESYIESTGSRYQETMYGAPKCKPLGGDLAKMVKAYRLKRNRTGIEGMGGMGFPSWVWSYQLREWK
jgi:hypothetical protein